MTAPVHMVDWYRVNPWKRMRVVLIVGPVLLSLGGLVVAVSFATRAPMALRELADIAGLLLIAAGVLTTMLGMHRILREDAYLSIRTDGVMLQGASSETLIAWDDLAQARWDAGRSAVVLERRDGEPVVVEERFATIDGPELAERIERARRRAAMGMRLA